MPPCKILENPYVTILLTTIFRNVSKFSYYITRKYSTYTTFMELGTVFE